MAQYLLPHHGGYAVEKFGIVSLNTTHRVLRTTILSSAILDASLVHPAIVFRTPAAHHATAIVLFHNHPSGDPTPSGDDVALTLVKGGGHRLSEPPDLALLVHTLEELFARVELG